MHYKTRHFAYRTNTFFLLVLGATSVCWSLGGLMSFRPGWNDYYMLPMLAGLMMPAIVAVTLIWRQPLAAMRQDFVHRLFSLRLIKPKALILSLMLMPLSVLLSILISVSMGGSVSQFEVSSAFSFSTGFVPVLALLFLAAVFEELGWRGYGFESLERGRSFLAASFLFGLLWSLWHLPLLWVNQSYQYEILQQSPWFALNFYVSTVVLGVIVTWVCHINQRSILVAILFHFAVNLSQEGFNMTQQTKGIQTLVLALFVLVLVVRQRRLFLRLPEP